MLLASVLTAVSAYLLGSVPTGYLLVRLFRHQDIRAVGSGNIGATNVLRTGGKGLGAVTFFLDTLKGCASVWLGAWLASMPLAAHAFAADSSLRFQAIAALFCVLGHMFPVWLRFKGGKGVAASFGVFLVAAPLAALASIGVFIVVFALSRYVSLGSILGAACFPLFAWMIERGRQPVFFVAVECAVAVLIIVKHHQNIRRLLAGAENRFGARKTA